MKKRCTLVAALLLATGVGTSQAADGDRPAAAQSPFAEISLYRNLDLPRHEKNFVVSLEYDVDGVVESALAQVLWIKLAQPSCSSMKIYNALEELAIAGATPATRYKAYLTRMVFDQPELFRNEGAGTYESADELFAAVAQRVEKAVLTAQAVP